MKAISEYKCQSLMGPPTIMIDLLNHMERKDYDLSSLKKIIMVILTMILDFYISYLVFDLSKINFVNN
jgi:hypothetical protein